MDLVLLSVPIPNHFLSRCPEGKWDGMKQGCFGHLCVGLPLKTGSSSHLYIQSLCTHWCTEGFRAAGAWDLERIWKALQAGRRLSELFTGFNISFDSLYIKPNRRPSQLCDIFRTRAKKSIDVSFPFSCLTRFKVSDSCCQFQKRKKKRPY